MAFVEPVTLSDRGIELVPMGVEHEDGLRKAASDGELWRLRITSVPEPDQTRAYIEDALASRAASSKSGTENKAKTGFLSSRSDTFFISFCLGEIIYRTRSQIALF